jgi:hypothetical protein
MFWRSGGVGLTEVTSNAGVGWPKAVVYPMITAPALKIAFHIPHSDFIGHLVGWQPGSGRRCLLDSTPGEVAPDSDNVWPQTRSLKHPDTRGDYHDNVQDRSDTPGHGDVGINQPQSYSHHYQRQHDIYD